MVSVPVPLALMLPVPDRVTELLPLLVPAGVDAAEVVELALPVLLPLTLAVAADVPEAVVLAVNELLLVTVAVIDDVRLPLVVPEADAPAVRLAVPV